MCAPTLMVRVVCYENSLACPSQTVGITSKPALSLAHCVVIPEAAGLWEAATLASEDGRYA